MEKPWKNSDAQERHRQSLMKNPVENRSITDDDDYACNSRLEVCSYEWFFTIIENWFDILFRGKNVVEAFSYLSLNFLREFQQFRTFDMLRNFRMMKVVSIVKVEG